MSTYTLFILFSLQLWAVRADESCDREKSERPAHLKLRDDLLCGYDPTTRPVKDSKTVTVVDVAQILRQIHIEDYSGSISLKGWIGMRWKDEYMSWDPKDYSDTKVIVVSASEIWTPDISEFSSHSMSEGSKVLNENARCLIAHDMYVSCITTSSLYSDCALQLKHWPFDTQNCTARLGTWKTTTEELSFNLTLLDLHGHYFHSSHWNVEHMSVSKSVTKLECCPGTTVPILDFNFIVKRIPSSYILTYLLPYFVMIIMTLTAMWLDPNTPDRVYFTALNIPCHLQMITNIYWEFPPHAELLRDSLMMCSATLVETIIVRAFLNTKKASPNWLSSSLSLVVNTKAGQLLLFSELNPEIAADNITSDDSTNLMNVSSERPKEWYLFGRIIDRVVFVIYVLIYVTMILLYIPK